MSTICKLNPLIRQRRAARRNLLRNPPLMKNIALRIAIMAEITLIAKSSRLTGTLKHKLFARGAAQMAAQS